MKDKYYITQQAWRLGNTLQKLLQWQHMNCKSPRHRVLVMTQTEKCPARNRPKRQWSPPEQTPVISNHKGTTFFISLFCSRASFRETSSGICRYGGGDVHMIKVTIRDLSTHNSVHNWMWPSALMAKTQTTIAAAKVINKPNAITTGNSQQPKYAVYFALE